jgi:plastocyanin
MTRKSTAMLITAATVCAVLLSACGSGDTSMSASANAVTIKNFAYAPANITVSKGTRVTLTNDDSTEHTATANGGGFDTGSISKGQSKTVSLDTPGTFPYVCTFHPFMHGTITVR